MGFACGRWNLTSCASSGAHTPVPAKSVKENPVRGGFVTGRYYIYHKAILLMGYQPLSVCITW